MDIKRLGACLAAVAIIVTTTLPVFGLEINVKDAGAKGDGVSDDSAVIIKATQDIEKSGGGLLFMPHGTYRFALHTRGAITFKATSNVTLRFDPGAVLLMDNLLKDGKGGGHGVCITGPCRNINLENICVKWKNRPSARSEGDGFRFEGYPDDAQTIADVRMVNCRTVGAPQTGAVFMGCSDIFVRDFNPIDTLADGLHFNSCRRVNVNGVIGLNTADDTLAFVTYFSEKPAWSIGNVFSQSDLNEWCNSDSTACNIISSGGTADGMRISGGLRIAVNNIIVTGKWGGIQLDSALATTKNRAVGWSYLASRGINISNAIINRCSAGLIVRTLNIPINAPATHWDFDVRVSDFQITQCKQIGVEIHNAGGVSVSGLSTDSGMSLINARGFYDLRDIRVSNSSCVIHGIQGKTFWGFTPSMEPLPIKVKDDLSDLVDGDISVTGLTLDNAPLKIEAVAGMRIRALKCRGKSPLSLTASRNCRFLDYELGGNPVKMEKCAGIVVPDAAKD